MGIALALAFLTIAFFSSLLIYCINLFRFYLPSSVRQSIIFRYVTLLVIRLQGATDFFLSCCLFPNYNYVVPNYLPELVGGDGGAAGSYDWKRAAAADVSECSVCLFNVDEGDEIGELRCGHVFHRLCLETWVRYSRFPCPLCRGSLAPARLDSDDAVVEHEVRLLVEFSACSFRDRERWWLR